MSKSDSPSSFFHINFTVFLKEFSSSFVPVFVSVAWLSVIFPELEQKSKFGVDFNLTECFEFTIVT